MIRRLVCVAVGGVAGVAGAAVTGLAVRWRRARERRWSAHADAVAADVWARAIR